MQIQTAEFLKSSPLVGECPSPHLPEYAFIGRSNVGKSSLINTLTNRKSLAKTSSTPGKTQLINHFVINQNWYLVDLPGYGWAKVGKNKRRSFEGMITSYLTDRKNLVQTFILVDIRHLPQAIDLEFMQWMSQEGLPFALIFTKADKLAKTKKEAAVQTYLDIFLQSWENLPPYFITSSLKKEGTEEILAYISQYNQEVAQQILKGSKKG